MKQTPALKALIEEIEEELEACQADIREFEELAKAFQTFEKQACVRMKARLKALRKQLTALQQADKALDEGAPKGLRVCKS